VLLLASPYARADGPSPALSPSGPFAHRLEAAVRAGFISSTGYARYQSVFGFLFGAEAGAPIRPVGSLVGYFELGGLSVERAPDYNDSVAHYRYGLRLRRVVETGSYWAPWAAVSGGLVQYPRGMVKYSTGLVSKGSLFTGDLGLEVGIGLHVGVVRLGLALTGFLPFTSPNEEGLLPYSGFPNEEERLPYSGLVFSGIGLVPLPPFVRLGVDL